MANETAGERAGRRFFIYGLVDPRDGLIHYVGRTCSPLEARRKQHISPRNRRRFGCGDAKRAWLVELFEAGLEPSIRELESFDDFAASNEAETKWIAHGKAQGWPLTNKQMKGGGGSVPREERRRRARQRASAEANYQRSMRLLRGEQFTVTLRGERLRRIEALIGLRGTKSAAEVLDEILEIGWAALERQQMRRTAKEAA